MMNSVATPQDRYPAFHQWTPLGVLAGGIFAIDLFVPLGVATGILYITIVLLSLRHRNPQFPIWMAMGCSTLTIVALFFSPVGGEWWKGLLNRALALFAIWTTALMGRFRYQQAETIYVREKAIQDFMALIPTACFSYDRHGTILSWNPAAERTYGYSQKEAIGTSAYDLMVTPETKQETTNVITAIFQGKSFEQKEWHDQKKDGKLGGRVGNLFPVFDADGHVLYGVNINMDLTDQKEAEFQAQTHQALLEAILNSSTDAIYAKDQQGKHLLVNHAATEVIGKSSEAIIGRDNSQLFDTETAQALNQIDDMVFEHTDAMIIEEEFLVHGQQRFFSTSKSRLKDSEGNIFGLVGISRDISDFKQIQKDLLLTDQVFMASPDHMSIVGRDYRYRRVNVAYEQAHKKPCKQFVGQSVSDILGAETFEQIVKPKLDRCFQGEEIHYESWFTFPGEQRQYMNVSYLPLTRENVSIQEAVVISRNLTDRKQAEEAIVQKEQQLRTILDAMTNFVGIGSVDGIVLDCNQTPLTLAGLTREDVIGKPLADTYWLNYSPQSQEQVRHTIQRVSQGERIREDHQVRMGENLFLTVDACYVPVKDTKGQVALIVYSSLDVTERRRSEVALQQSEDQFRNLYESAPLAYFSASFEGKITRVNSRASDLLGYSQDELVGKHVLTLYAPSFEGFEKAAKIQQQAQQGIAVYDEELEMMRKDGQTLWVSLTVRLIYDKSGEIIERRGMAQDISARKRIESELRASEYRYRSLIKTAGNIIIGLTPEGWIVEWNREAERFFGKTREEALAQNYFETFIQESDRSRMMIDIKKALDGTPSRDFENVQLNSEGKMHQVLWNMDRLLDENQQPYGLICIGRDITKRKTFEETIQSYNEELEKKVTERTTRIQELEQRRMQVEKLAALSQIAAGVAHEINNPLASISQSLTLLKRAISAKHPHYRYIAKIEDRIDRMAQITKHLFQLYCPSSQTPMPLDLGVLIQDAVEIMRVLAANRQQCITFVTSPTTILAAIPRNELTQVLCNLLQNAIDASCPQKTIEVHMASEQDTVVIRVVDHGHGIPPDVTSHIFEPFFTTKQGKSEGGMGLGLAISHSLIQSMGGTLDFSTSIGQGTTFTITLPLT